MSARLTRARVDALIAAAYAGIRAREDHANETQTVDSDALREWTREVVAACEILRGRYLAD